MGVDFTALISHNLTPSTVSALPQILSPTSASSLSIATQQLAVLLKPDYPFIEATPHWQARDSHNAQAFDAAVSWRDATSVDFEGPAGLLLWIGQRTISLWNVTRWTTFLSNRQLQLALRRVCYEFASVVGTSQAVYLPDSGFAISEAHDLVDAGGSMEAIEVWFAQHNGQPVEDLAALYDAIERIGWEANGYYIDRFTDMR